MVPIDKDLIRSKIKALELQSAKYRDYAHQPSKTLDERSHYEDLAEKCDAKVVVLLSLLVSGNQPEDDDR